MKFYQVKSCKENGLIAEIRAYDLIKCLNKGPIFSFGQIKV